MSLETGYSNLFRKPSNEYAQPPSQKFYTNKGFEEISQTELCSNILMCDSNSSSQMSDSCKSSLELEGARFSQEIEKILSKHLKQSSMVENNVKNNYSGLLEGLKNASLGKISEVSYEDSQKENRDERGKKGFSGQVSEVESQTVVEELSSKVEVKVKKPISGVKCSLRISTFALTNRIFCLKCCTDVYTNVNYQMKTMNIWGSIGFFLEAIKCCGEPRMMSRYQELVHTCKVCGTVVARITTS